MCSYAKCNSYPAHAYHQVYIAGQWDVPSVKIGKTFIKKMVINEVPTLLSTGHVSGNAVSKENTVKATGLA